MALNNNFLRAINDGRRTLSSEEFLLQLARENKTSKVQAQFLLGRKLKEEAACEKIIINKQHRVQELMAEINTQQVVLGNIKADVVSLTAAINREEY